MELSDTTRSFEDLPVGTTYRTPGRTITESDLIGFVNFSGMNGEMFTNVEYARTRTAFGGRVVPGMLSLVFGEALNALGPIRGAGLALLGLDVEFEAPVTVGDTIHAEVEVIEARPSGSRPGVGFVRFRHRLLKQDGTAALTYTAKRMIRRRQQSETPQ